MHVWKDVTVKKTRRGTFLVFVISAMWIIACDSAANMKHDGGDHSDISYFRCWYRSTANGIVNVNECPMINCIPTIDGNEIVCPCGKPFPCDCQFLPNSENSDDGIYNLFACFWVNDICYKGPKDPPYSPPPLDCFCYAGYFCWKECEGRFSEEGEKVCMVDGKEVECRYEPPKDNKGRVVLCRYGSAPTEWPPHSENGS